MNYRKKFAIVADQPQKTTKIAAMTPPTTLFRFLFHFAKQQWLKFSIIIFSFIVWAVSDTFFPYFLRRIIDHISNFQGARAGIYAAISGTLVLVVLFWVMSEFFMRLEGILQIYAFPTFRAQIRDAVFKHVLAHSHDYFATHFSGNLAKKLSDLATSAESVMEIISFQFVTAGTGAVIVLVMMYLTSPLFAWLLIAWLALHLIITFIFFRFANRLAATHADAVSTLSGKIVDAFTNILTVRLFAREKFESTYLNQYQDDEIKKAKRAKWMLEIMRIGLGLNGLFLIFGMIFLLLHGWVQHWINIGDFTQILMQAFWLLGWMWYISFQLSIFSRETGTIDDALHLIRKAHDLQDQTNAADLMIHAGEIKFDHVYFHYHRRAGVFNNLTLTIPAGKKMGLVGFSGSGKSTFVNLILRFYDIQSGQILIDGQNIANVTQTSLRDHIAMIPQDPTLFHRTLMENIRYGRLDATDEEVIHAAKLAHCDQFIQSLDEGYQSLVGERGVKLSGGQRQRIAIARAILKNAPILILDEATSSLDTVTEKLIQDSLNTLMHDKTTIVIAHRLSTLADMDMILVFKDGAVVESGTKETLLQTNGHFAMLWNMQTDGFLPGGE